jgi:hypothetical protein
MTIRVPWQHVCRPPRDQPAGTLWICGVCWSEYVYRPVAVGELGGRVINLWVLHYSPGAHQAYVPPKRRNRKKKASV